MANATERAIRRNRKHAATAASRPPRPNPPVFKRKKNPKKGISKVRKSSAAAASSANLVPLGDNILLEAKGLKPKKSKKDKEKAEVGGGKASRDEPLLLSTLPAAQQLQFFLGCYQSTGGFKLSALELEAFKDTSIVELAQDVSQDAQSICRHIKYSFKTSWKEVLCDGALIEGKIDPGSPVILIISASALRSLELLRGLKKLSRECRPAKLFAKHMKVEDQVASLKSRVNIASGTPSRIKKLIDMDALGLSRLAMIVVDMHRDAKGYSLLTLPQVSKEFWDLYKSYFHERHIQGELRICFYGSTSSLEFEKVTQSNE